MADSCGGPPPTPAEVLRPKLGHNIGLIGLMRILWVVQHSRFHGTSQATVGMVTV